jgi:hypothetical protein
MTVFVLDGAALARGKARAQADDPAVAALRQAAEAALTAGPFSVMDKALTPPSGDKHDYLSHAPYWWPDPQQPDGRPYLRRDGELNPQSREGTDREPLHAMAEAVDTLALAYFFTEHAPYAAHAARLLRTWFLDPATRMHPHLTYGQGIPGHIDGRGIGIIDTVVLPRVCDAVGLLAGSAAWSADDQRGMEDWFAAYLNWLRTSSHGMDEARQHNNHGTWYDAQVACYALFTGQPDVARATLEAVTARRIATQIAPDGRQPDELARTRPLSYSRFNLQAYCTLAALGRHIGIDLWHARTDDGRGIHPALTWLAPYLCGAARWPHAEVLPLPVPNTAALQLLRWAGHVYGDAALTDAAAALPGVTPELWAADRSALVYPTRTTMV